jgi:hypothetical protein
VTEAKLFNRVQVTKGFMQAFSAWEALDFWLVQAKLLVAAAGFESATKGL